MPKYGSSTLYGSSSAYGSTTGGNLYGRATYGSSTYGLGAEDPDLVAGGNLSGLSEPTPVDVGDTITVTLQTFDLAGVLGDVATLSLSATAPDGTVSTATPTRIAVGTYEVQFTAAMEGRYLLLVTATGGIFGGTTQVWADIVDASIGRSFVSLAEAVAHLRMKNPAAAKLEQLRWLIQVACEAIELDLGRTVSRRTVVETHLLDGSIICLRQTPVLSVTSVTVDGVAAAPDSYVLDPSTGLLQSRDRWRSSGWRSSVTVTYAAGFAVAPTVLRKVALNGVERMWQTSQQAPHPAFGEGGGGGGEFAATAIMAQLGRLTPLEYGAYLAYRPIPVA